MLNLDLSDNQISKKENESIISKMKTKIKKFYISTSFIFDFKFNFF